MDTLICMSVAKERERGIIDSIFLTQVQQFQGLANNSSYYNPSLPRSQENICKLNHDQKYLDY